MANLNKANSWIRGSEKSVAQLQKELDNISKQMGVKRKSINIPKVYKASFGDPMMFSVNGVRVEIPLGEDIMVPEPHYIHANRLMAGAVMVKGQQRPEPEEVYKD